MTTVLCVLRSGGEFDCGHVARLAMQVREHSPAGTPFVCLTDQPERVGHWCARPLRHGWPGWWSKVEAFSVPGPALYLDLDVTVVGDLSPLLDAAGSHELLMAQDFWLPHVHTYNSSVMGWSGDVSSILAEFAEAPAAHMNLYSRKEKWGDQAFVRDTWAGDVATWQEVLPGMVHSFKRGALMGADLSDARVVVSHGQPRPWARDGADAWLRTAGLAR